MLILIFVDIKQKRKLYPHDTESSSLNHNKYMNNISFIKVPIPLLRHLITDRDVITEIRAMGIMTSANSLEIDSEKVLKKFVYEIYNGFDWLPYDLQDYYDLMDFPYSGFYRGFTGDKEPLFTCELELEYLTSFCDEHPDFLKAVTEWYRIHQMSKLLGCCYSDVNEIIKLSKGCQSKYDLNNAPDSALNWKVMTNITNDIKSSTADERAALAMYLGILSILGNKEYVVTTSDMIKCRMFGAKNQEELQDLLNDESFKKTYDHFTSKRRYEKYRDNVLNDFGIVKVTLKRKLYLSVRKKTEKSLIDAIIADEAKKDNRTERKKREKDAIDYYYSCKKG